MEWLSKLRGTTVGLDTAPLIYFIERHPTYFSLVHPFFSAVESGDIQVVTSTLTLTEVLIHPYRKGDIALARQYYRILRGAANLRMLAPSTQIAAEAARIRAAHGLKTPDAIQMATALSERATAFLTNDTGISSIPGLSVTVLEKLLTAP
jgi:predicted nucleic acid-binding protein